MSDVCNNCPAEGCEDCPNMDVMIDGADGVSVDTIEVGNVDSVEIGGSESVEVNSNEFAETPAIFRLIHTLGESAQSIHNLAKEMHPGDAGICVALAAQIGAVAQMFVTAVEVVKEQNEQRADLVDTPEVTLQGDEG